MSSRRPTSLWRLIGMATLLAAVASCMVGYIVVELSRDAASDAVVMQPLLLFSGWCFAVTWPAVFLIGWYVMRRRAEARRAEDDR